MSRESALRGGHWRAGPALCWRTFAVRDILATTMSANVTTTSTTERDTAGRFVIGAKPGPGRPKGARSKLGEQFLEDLAATWQTHGKRALEQCAVSSPEQFCRIVAGLLPAKAELDVSLFADVENFAQAFELAAKTIGATPRIPKGRLIELEAKFDADR